MSRLAAILALAALPLAPALAVASGEALSADVAAVFRDIGPVRQTLAIDAVCSNGRYRNIVHFGGGWSGVSRALAAVALDNAIGNGALSKRSEPCDLGSEAAFTRAEFVTTSHGLLMEPVEQPLVLPTERMDPALRSYLKP